MKKINKRSIFSKIFGDSNNTDPKSTAASLKVLNGYQSVFTNFDGHYYDTSIVRGCIDTIARNTAKLNPRHIRNSATGFEKINGNLYTLLSKKPNELQNAYQFYYYIVTELEMYNDAFVYILRDKNTLKISGLYPIHYETIKFYEYQDEIWIEFSFGNSQRRFVALKDCIHLTRFTNKDIIVGGSNIPLIKTLSVKHILTEGIINAIKTTQSIKGVIKSTKVMLKPEDTKQMRDQFVKDFIENADGSGIGGLDASTEFTPVKIDPTTANEYQIKSVDNEILSYFGVNENILQSKFTEDEWSAFYESVIEPISIQLGLEFTNKLFTQTELSHGNEIIFTSNRLQYASNNTKINLMRYGNNIMTVNEMREVLNLEPIEDGDKIMQDLNHIDGSIANEYQKGGKGNEE